MNRRPWVQTEGGFLILLAAMLLLLPLRWVGAMVLAASFHELCHYGMIRLLGGRVYGLRLGARGIQMEIAPMDPWTELLAAMAGPVGSALLVLPAKWMPRLAVCGLIHCCFNLIPLFPMDGGRILHSITELIWPPEQGRRLFRSSQRVLTWVLVAGSTVLFLKWKFFPGFIFLILLLRQRRKRIV